MRDYGTEGQIGLEPILEEYISKLLKITMELKRVLKPTGVMFWNHGDCYGGGKAHFDFSKGQGKYNKPFYSEESLKKVQFEGIKKNSVPQKCLALQNYRLILKMIDNQGWILRNTIIWHKPNHMPSSVKDRFTNAYEPIFILVKNKKYWFDLDVVRQPHKEISKQRILRAVSNKHKYINNPKYGGGGGINKPRSNRKTKIPVDTAELYGSPRARYHREGNMAISQYQYGEGDYLVTNLYPGGKNPGDVWKIPTQPFSEAHFATFPEKLIEPMILAGCPRWICKKCGKAKERITEVEYIQPKTRGSTKINRMKDKEGFRPNVIYSTVNKTLDWTDCGCNADWEAGVVLDPFMGSGTVALVAKRNQRNFIGFDNNLEYIKIANKRISKVQVSMF